MMHLVIHMDGTEDKSPKAITVRVPESVYGLLREYANKRNLSLNSVVAEAIAQYSNRIRRVEVISDIEAFQQSLRHGRRHEGESDSVKDLRELRLSRSLRGSHRKGAEDRPDEGEDPA